MSKNRFKIEAISKQENRSMGKNLLQLHYNNYIKIMQVKILNSLVPYTMPTEATRHVL